MDKFLKLLIYQLNTVDGKRNSAIKLKKVLKKDRIAELVKDKNDYRIISQKQKL